MAANLKVINSGMASATDKQTADRAKALASGFDLHMTKPARVDELLAEIARFGSQQRPAVS